MEKTLIPIIELFKKSFDEYIKQVWNLAGIMLFGCLGMVALLPFMLVVFLISFSAFSIRHFSITLILVDVLFILIGTFFAIIIGLWSRVALFCAVKNNALNIKQILISAWPKIASFFWISLLAGLAVMGGFILFVIPGIIFAVWFGFSIYVFIFDGIKGSSALKKSKELVKGYWWPVFARFLVIWIVAMLISWIKGLGPIINVFFVIPFCAVYLKVLYEDLKIVKNK
jgi:hypothetical protein